MITTASSTRTLGDFPFDPGAFAPGISIDIVRLGYAADSDEPRVSFVIPVHNQAALIRRNLQSVTANASSVNEIIVVVDASTDDTLREVMAWADALPDGSTATIGVTVVHTHAGVFETIADSIGFTLATGTTIIEVQADMQISHPGFDSLLADALAEHQDVIAISGRGAHSFALARAPRTTRERASAVLFALVHRVLTAGAQRVGRYVPRRIELRLGDRIGRVGDLVELPAALDLHPPLVVHDTVMRGPLAMDRSRLESIGGLDTTHFFLGNDDHDLAMRAVLERGLRCAYVPISFSSPLEEGTTRARRTPAAEAEFSRLRAHYAAAFDDSVLGRHIPTPPRLARSWRQAVPSAAVTR